jgi:excisionase family DNA binding protein
MGGDELRLLHAMRNNGRRLPRVDGRAPSRYQGVTELLSAADYCMLPRYQLDPTSSFLGDFMICVRASDQAFYILYVGLHAKLEDTFTCGHAMGLTLDITECAEFLKIEKQYALRLAAEGKLPGAKVGRAWVFLVDDLVEYLRQQVRLQQRERSAEADLLTEPWQGTRPSTGPQPLARGRKNRSAPIDFAKYEAQLPKTSRQV